MLLNLAVVERVIASHAPIRPYRRLALAATSARATRSSIATSGFFVFSLPL